MRATKYKIIQYNIISMTDWDLQPFSCNILIIITITVIIIIIITIIIIIKVTCFV